MSNKRYVRINDEIHDISEYVHSCFIFVGKESTTTELCMSQENKEHRREYNKQWKKENKEYYNEYQREYYKEHPDKTRARTHRRRTRKANAQGDYTAKDIKRLYNKQEGKCLYCGCNLGEDYHVDHFIPLAKHGKNSPDNLAIACADCNLSKNSTVPYDWYKWNGQFPLEWTKAICTVVWLR